MNYEKILLEPLVTEKSVGERARARYVFRVNPLANKLEVKQAVEKYFKVKVKDVNTSFVRPKRRVTGRSIGQTARAKKAYVTLATGQKIEELEA